MPVNLTDTAIRKLLRDAAATGKRIGFVDPAQAGLLVRASPSGIVSWSWYGRSANGKLHRIALGRWPAMGLGDARAACRSMRERVNGGVDPVGERRRARAEAREPTSTLSGLLDVYEKQQTAGKKSWPRERRRIENVVGTMITKPLATLTLLELQLRFDEWSSPFSAAQAVRNLRPVLRWAAQPSRGYVKPELAQLVAEARSKPRERVLSADELGRLWPVLRAGNVYGEAMRLILLTAARREEVGGMRVGELDLDAGVWVIPAERTKSGREHRVSLSRQAVAVLRTRVPAGAKPDALVFTGARGKLLRGWHQHALEIQATSETSGWTRHDLRRTTATLLARLGAPPHVVEAALAHAHLHSGLASVYNRHRYEDEVREWLQRLADHLDALGAAGGAVNGS